MGLVDDFRAALRELRDDWNEASFRLRLGDEERAARAGRLLATVNAGRHRDSVQFSTARGGGGHDPELVARALRRLDDEGLDGELELVASRGAERRPETRRETLAASWDAALAELPADWSDVHAELELGSTGDLDRAALLVSPLNPSRHGDRPSFRFRVARSFGYGASPEMARRSLERLDEAGIRGRVKVLRALSDTRPWATQGPVWYVGGKPV